MIEINDIKLIKFLEWLEKSKYDISEYLHGEYKTRQEIENRYANTNAKYPSSPPGVMSLMIAIKPDMSGYHDNLLEKISLLRDYNWKLKRTYKCIFLCNNSNDGFKFDELLLKDTWHDLNSASGEFLDIIYEETKDKARNGYQYISELELDIPLPSVPCIVLWKEKIKKHIVLSIKELNKADILQVLIKIADLSKRLYTLDQIENSVVELIEKLRTKKLSQSNNIIVSPVISPIMSPTFVNTVNVTYQNVIDEVNGSKLQANDKMILEELLKEIEKLNAKKDKKTIWSKVKEVFGFIASKSVDVGLAITVIPYLMGLL